jgi:hypothetical protein
LRYKADSKSVEAARLTVISPTSLVSTVPFISFVAF